MKQPYDAIAWWEVRRIPYNLALFATGLLSLSLIEWVGSYYVASGEDVIEPILLIIASVSYGIAANIFYTLGWITEILWSEGKTDLTQPLRAKIFCMGLIFSIALTLLPAILILMAWPIHSLVIAHAFTN